MMYHAFPSPTANALSGLRGLGLCTLTSDDGQTCLVDTSDGGAPLDITPPSSSSSGNTPILAPGQSYNASTNTIFDPVTGNTMDARTGAILSGPLLTSSPWTNYSSSPVGSPSTGFNWGFLTPIASSLANVFGTRYAVPQLNPGQTIQTGPGGTLITQQPAGLPATGGLPAAIGGISTSTLLLFGGVGVVVMMLMKRGK